MWYCLVFNKYSYYCDFVRLWPALRLIYRHHHVWVRYVHTVKITVACMSSLLLSIDLRQICYLIMFYFKLTNVAIEKFCKAKWCNGEIKNGTSHLFSHKYWICLFVLFLNTTFSLIIKDKQNLIRYCNASSFVVVFRNGKTEKYVNILSIISTLSPLASRHRCRCWCLVVAVGVLALAHLHQIYWRRLENGRQNILE